MPQNIVVGDDAEVGRALPRRVLGSDARSRRSPAGRRARHSPRPRRRSARRSASLDLKRIRDDPEAVKAALARRGAAGEIDELLRLDERRRELLPEVEGGRARQNQASEAIAEAKRAGRDAESEIAEMRELAAEIKRLEARARARSERERDELALTLPNLPDPDAPEARSEEDAIVLREVGERPELRLRGPRPPRARRRARGLIDMEHAARASGSRFAYLMGDLVMVELALVRFALGLLAEEGFIPVVPPVLVREEPLEGTGFFPGDREMIYEIPRDELFLVGTSEVSLAALHMDEILAAEDVPAALRRLLDLLPARGRRRREGHARDLPRAPVRQGRDVLVRRARRARPRSTSACSASRSGSCSRSRSPTASSTSRSATSAPRPHASSTARAGSRARIATASSPRARTRPTSRRGAWAAATGPPRERRRSRCTPSTAPRSRSAAP